MLSMSIPLSSTPSMRFLTESLHAHITEMLQKIIETSSDRKDNYNIILSVAETTSGKLRNYNFNEHPRLLHPEHEVPHGVPAGAHHRDAAQKERHLVTEKTAIISY
jgi:hypothetical protein